MKKNSSFFLWLKARKRKQDEKRRKENETTTTTQRWRDKTGPAIGYCSKFFWLRIFLFLRSYHRCCYFLLFSCVRISLFFLLSVLLVSMSRLFFSALPVWFFNSFLDRFKGSFLPHRHSQHILCVIQSQWFSVYVCTTESSRCLKHLRDVACTKACTYTVLYLHRSYFSSLSRDKNVFLVLSLSNDRTRDERTFKRRTFYECIIISGKSIETRFTFMVFHLCSSFGRASALKENRFSRTLAHIGIFVIQMQTTKVQPTQAIVSFFSLSDHTRSLFPCIYCWLLKRRYAFSIHTEMKKKKHTHRI